MLPSQARLLLCHLANALVHIIVYIYIYAALSILILVLHTTQTLPGDIFVSQAIPSVWPWPVTCLRVGSYIYEPLSMRIYP